MKTVEFLEHTTEISNEDLNQHTIDIDFNSEMMIQFEKHQEGYVAVNGINGYGINIKNEVFGKFLIIKEENNG